VLKGLGCLVILMSCLCSCSALAAKFNVSMLTAEVGGTKIPIYLYKPEGKGPFPLIVLSHGSPRDEADRKNFGPDTLSDQARAFVRRGAAVAVPIRRGFGGNGVLRDMYQGNCSRPNYYDAGLVSAGDIGAAIRIVAKQPEIDAKRVVLVGHSAGGFASIAAATREKILGVVGFAPGRGSLEPDKVICKPQLLSALARYGHASHAPELWIYSENDHFFGPELAKQFYDRFTKAGGQATFVAAPSWGQEGHAYIEAISSWQPDVDAFLKKIGFFGTP
jgi:dienelactone hydrolase